MLDIENINKGRNAEMASRSPTLDGYETFIAEIKSNLDSSMNLAEAIEAAIKTCLNKNILVSFLREHGAEVLNMIFTEWNWEDAIAVAKEEAFEDGIGKGIDIGIGKGVDIGREEVFTLLRQGYSLDEAEKMLGLNRSQFSAS